MIMKRILLIILTLNCAIVFSGLSLAQNVDPLPSWNDGKAKLSIIQFVAKVTKEGTPNFVRPEERIATFDNDGTLWSEQVYGIPPEQVIGSSIKTKFEAHDGKPVLVRLPELNFIDDKEGKPVGINQHIGRRPIAAFGNSDGDLQMLQWTTAGQGPRFALYVHHTDSEREWAYDRESSIGRLDRGLDEAREKGWTVVDMAQDWKIIYTFEKR